MQPNTEHDIYEVMKKVSDAISVLQQQRDEARRYAKLSFELVRNLPADNNVLLGLPEDHDFPDWIYE